MNCCDSQNSIRVPPTDDTVDFLRLAELDGMEAFVGGGAVEENPFTPGTDLHRVWLDGFKLAEARHGR